MPIGYATDTLRASFRKESPLLAAAQQPNQASGDYGTDMGIPPTVDMALNSIGASDLEREVVQLVCRVHGPRSALRVVGEYRATRKII